MFSKILNWIKEVISKMLSSDVSKTLGVDVQISSPMADSIKLWSDMYNNKPKWLDELDDNGNPAIKSLNLASAISSEFARLATIEMKSEVTGNDYLNEIYQEVIDDLRVNAEYACAKGGLMIKPYLSGDKIALNYIQADNFFPTKFDDKGNITGAIFVDKIVKGKYFYKRFESHNWIDNITYEIKNVAYKSESATELGHQIPLTDVEEWANIEPLANITGSNKPLFTYIKMPFANIIDNNSPLGVSVFARAVNLIEEADRQYSRLLWEFEGGELAVHADITTFDTEGNQPKLDKRLFKAINSGDASLYEVFAPSLRDESLINGLNAILRKIEFTCGLAYGTLSDETVTDKTATEIKASKQRSYATVCDIQKALEKALRDLLETIDNFAQLYDLAPKKNYDVSFEWDDSIVTDTDTEFARRLQLASAGIISNAELRAWYLGETVEEAEKNLPEIKVEKIFEME